MKRILTFAAIVMLCFASIGCLFPSYESNTGNSQIDSKVDPCPNNIDGCNIEVLVNYRQPLLKMLDSSNYRIIKSDTFNEENFLIPSIAPVEVELVLVHLPDFVVWDEESIWDYLHSKGLSPARLEHLLALGATYPILINKEIRILVLGSSITTFWGNRWYPDFFYGLLTTHRIDQLPPPVRKVYFLAIRSERVPTRHTPDK